MDEERFKELVDKFGKVLRLKVVVDDIGYLRGFGFVFYELYEEV